MTPTKALIAAGLATLAPVASAQAQSGLEPLIPDLLPLNSGDKAAPKVSHLRAKGPERHWLMVSFRSSEQADAVITVHRMKGGKYRRVKQDKIWVQGGRNRHAMEVGERAQYRVTVRLRDEFGNSTQRRVTSRPRGR